MTLLFGILEQPIFHGMMFVQRVVLHWTVRKQQNTDNATHTKNSQRKHRTHLMTSQQWHTSFQWTGSCQCLTHAHANPNPHLHTHSLHCVHTNTRSTKYTTCTHSTIQTRTPLCTKCTSTGMSHTLTALCTKRTPTCRPTTLHYVHITHLHNHTLIHTDTHRTMYTWINPC